MGMYTAIVDTGNAIVSLLRNNLVPDIITNPDSIGLCSPDERGDILLGIHLYDVRESKEMHDTSMLTLDSSYQRYPSIFLTLSFMITAYSTADNKFKAAEEQKIIGKVIQVLRDNAVLDFDKTSALNPNIIMQTLETDEKQKLWQFPNMAYKLSLFYKVTPVEIMSEKLKTTKRVTQANFIAIE